MNASERVATGAGAMVVLACVTFGGSGPGGASQPPEQGTLAVVSGRQPAACVEPGTGAAVPRTPVPARHVPGTMRAV